MQHLLYLHKYFFYVTLHTIFNKTKQKHKMNVTMPNMIVFKLCHQMSFNIRIT